MNRRPFAQTAFLSVMGRAGGLVIPFLIAAFYGATVQTDAFFLAYTLAIAFTTLFSQMFETAIIPYLAAFQGSVRRVMDFMRQAFFRSLPFFVGAGLLLTWALKPLLQAAGWNLEGAKAVQETLLWLQPFLWFGLGTAAWNGIFYNRGLFWFPAISPLLRSGLVAVFILGLHKVLGIHALTAGFVLGEALRFLMASKLGARVAAEGHRQSGEDAEQQALMGKFFGDAFWQMGALLAVHCMVIADQCFAQTAGEGQLTLLSYADRLIQIPYLLFLAGFLNIFHADWSRACAEDSASLYARLKRDLFWVTAGAAAAAFILILTAKAGVHLFYGNAPLSEVDRGVLTGLFIWYSVALAPGVLRLALGRVLIVLRASRFYFAQAWVELGLNIVFNIFFMKHFGVVGIAMATALVYTLSAIWLCVYVWARRQHVRRKKR